MTTVILVGLIVVLLAAAAYVGVLLLRRSRSTADEPGAEADARPRTVADLVKRRTAPANEADAELSGDELFVAAVPRRDGVAVPEAAAEPDGLPAATPAPQPATPAGGLEIGDAPWRRAARMTGAEPGGAWETAPIPVVAEPARAGEAPAAPEVRTGEMRVPDGAAAPAPSAVVIVSRAPKATAATLWHELDEMRAAVRSDPAAAHGPEPEAAPASPWTEPAAAAEDEAGEEEAGVEEPAAGQQAVEEQAVEEPTGPAPASRPLSDPDLTPLMGIPVIRPAAEVVPPAEPATVEPAAAADPQPLAPTPRTTRAPEPDDDVVFLVPPTGSFAVVAPVVSGSPQPVWFRVVRRDGEPVSAAVVALLDDHGREVDTTKTATDGGGELRAPHGGRFLMIVSADGHQPRAATLTVDEEPVELALLLPRSATVSGSVRAGDAVVRDARVVVRQHHDVVDEASTAGDGHYRFDDLAEGTYVVSASADAGGAAARVSLVEGADVRVDLDLR